MQLELNPDFATELATSDLAKACVTQIADTAVTIAQANAPVGDASDPHYQHGARPGGYRRSIKAKVGKANYPGIGPAWVARVLSNNYKARWFENGTANIAPKRVLAGAVAAAANSGVDVAT